jgi:hypothetical protein
VLKQSSSVHKLELYGCLYNFTSWRDTGFVTRGKKPNQPWAAHSEASWPQHSIPDCCTGGPPVRLHPFLCFMWFRESRLCSQDCKPALLFGFPRLFFPSRTTLEYYYIILIVWKELIACFPWYYTDSIENDTSNNSSVVAYVFVAAEKF